MVYGEIEVEMQSEKEKNDWMIREFKLSIVSQKGRGLMIDRFRPNA